MPLSIPEVYIVFLERYTAHLRLIVFNMRVLLSATSFPSYLDLGISFNFGSKDCIGVCLQHLAFRVTSVTGSVGILLKQILINGIQDGKCEVPCLKIILLIRYFSTAKYIPQQLQGEG